MRVVGGDYLNAVFVGKPYKVRQYDFLFGNIVVLNFYIKILAEHALEFFNPTVGGGEVLFEYRLRNNARYARG